MTYGAQDFRNEDGVNASVFCDFQRWHDLLLSWNAKINLVSKTALDGFWARHALDSWQVTPHIPTDAKSILDLGSGGGFPGLALAIHAKHTQADRRITLVESAGKKANFLRTVTRELELPVTVKSERVETLPSSPFDIISARAFAPLDRLLDYAFPFWAGHTKALLLKGQGVTDEIQTAQTRWGFSYDLIPSKSDPEARLLVLSALQSNS